MKGVSSVPGGSWSWRRRILFVFSAVSVLSVAGLGLIVLSEWTYIPRLRHFQKQLPTPPTWYEPKEIVRGASTARVLPVANPGATSLSTDLIRGAMEHAVAGRASGFLILHRGLVRAE